MVQRCTSPRGPLSRFQADGLLVPFGTDLQSVPSLCLATSLPVCTESIMTVSFHILSALIQADQGSISRKVLENAQSTSAICLRVTLDLTILGQHQLMMVSVNQL